MAGVDVQEALDQKKAHWEEAFGQRYVRFSDDYHGVPRGTAAFDGTTIRGYPQIGRILSLEKGLAEQFRESFWIEEKVNGYNVRIASVGGRALAFSRGGFICAFTTDRLPDLLDLSVFDHEPDLVICAEVAGPENPYVESSPPFVKEDVQLFTFDLMRQGAEGYLDQEEKMELIKRYRLPATHIFGRFHHDQIESIREIALQMDREGREGLVFKEDSPGRKRAKYVVGSANLADIRDTALHMMDMQPHFFTDRILRLMIFLEEHGLTATSEVRERLGAAFVDRLEEALAQFRRTHRVSHVFVCRFRDYDNAVYMMRRLRRLKGQGLQVLRRRLEKEGDYWVLEFERVSTRMVGLLGHTSGGGMTYD